MTARERVRHLVEELPDSELATAERLLRPLRSRREGEPENEPADNVLTDLAAFTRDLDALAEGAPAAEVDRLPADLSENLDHYLYGVPKRSADQ